MQIRKLLKSKKIIGLLILSYLLSICVFTSGSVVADDLDDIQNEIDSQNRTLEQINKDLEESKKKVADLSDGRGGVYWTLSNTQSELDGIKNQIEGNTADIETLEGSIGAVQSLISDRVDQKNVRLRNIYFDYRVPFIDQFLGEDSLGTLDKLWKYKEAGLHADKEDLHKLNEQLTNLENNLAEGKFLQEELVAVNTELEKLIEDFNIQIVAYNQRIAVEQQNQANISGQISAIEGRLGELTVQQEEIIRQRIEEANRELHLSEGELLTASIPDAPFTGGFTVASYGAPHRVGMNQYGALGRANSGQSAEQILGAYFANVEIDKNYGSNYMITVNDSNEYGQTFNNTQYNIEEYVKHLYEMPASWPTEALKAQAISARTYALKYTNNGSSSICPSQACQVVKYEMNAQAWRDAVDATAGWVIKNSGALITPWYSSTTGGYTKLPTEVGWYSNPTWVKSIKDYGSNGAYDGPAYGNSPWYHKTWGEIGGVWGGSCSGDCHPWLTNLQAQDLFNVILLRQSVDSQYNLHLSPYHPAVSRHPDSWSEQQVIDKLVELGITPVSNISSISVYENPSNGDTVKIIVQSVGYSSVEFDALEFKDIYYLRSPGTLVIKSSRFDFVGS